MKRILALIALLCAPLFGHAATYYYSDCQTGADPACVAGANGNGGTSSAAPRQTVANAVTLFQGAACGDNILFAKGGSWTFTTRNDFYNIANGLNCISNPITVGSYTPSWGAGTARPLWTNLANTNEAIYNWPSGSPKNHGGYVFRDIKLKVKVGIAVAYGAKYVTYDNLWVEGTFDNTSDLAFYCLTSNNTAPGSGDGETTHIKLINSTITGFWGGTLEACSQVLIENNDFANNGANGSNLSHHLYWGGPATTIRGKYAATQVIIRGNRFKNGSVTTGQCSAPSIVMHDDIDGAIIENNTLIEEGTVTDGGCWGMSFDAGHTYAESMKRIQIRGNKVINYRTGIGLDLCTDCVIENNAICSNLNDSTGIRAPRSKNFENLQQDSPPYDQTPQRNKIRNNSVYFSNPDSTTRAFDLSAHSGDPTGTGHEFVSNLAIFASGTTATSYFTNTSNLPDTAFAAFNNNLAYYAGTVGYWNANGSLSLAAWKTHTIAGGLNPDTSSLNTTPSVSLPAVGTCDLSIPTGSNAKNAGHTTLSSKISIGAKLRDATPDIGAWEFGSSVVIPGAPAWVDIQ